MVVKNETTVCLDAQDGIGVVPMASQSGRSAEQESMEDSKMNVIAMTIDEPAPQRSRFRMFAVLAALYLSLFIAALDQTIISTAVPTIVSQLHSSSGYVWIMSAYSLANAAAGPIWAKVSDIWGRKFIILSAVAFFFGSSIICAEASTMKMLIVGRALQGTAGGGLIVLTIICVSDLFSVRDRSLYLGLTEMMWAVAGGAGPVLGGAFTEKLSWRWCFWINLPISGTAFILLFVFLDVHNPKTKLMDGFKAIDWFGSISILGLTLMLLLGLDFGGATFPWNSPQVICLIVFGCIMSVFFFCSEKFLARYPLMPLDLLNNRSNVASLVLTFFHGMVMIAIEFFFPMYLQAVKASDPLQSGILVVPVTVSAALTGILTGVLIHRTGRYLELIYVGTTLMTLGLGLYILFSPTTSTATIIGIQIIAGVGAGCLFEPPLIALQAFVTQDEMATTSSTAGFVRNLATSLSVVLGGVVFQNSMSSAIPGLAAAGVPASITGLLSDGGAAAHVDIVSSIANPAEQNAVKEAFSGSLRNMWIMYTCISAIALFSSFFIGRRTLSKIHVETKTGLKKEADTIVGAE